ncbi:MAG: heme exporter protein CcmB [Chloroflexi bacterium]|nr:heme exporter protein CcmB [Chloroflexota bacterium]MBU1746656.1 heme exporter protein CcmB [Chloroflexota bacterium]
MKDFFRVTWAITRKDLLAEWRSRETVATLFTFTLLVMVIFGFAVEAATAELGAVAPGIMWVSLCFAGVLLLNRSFQNEGENECIAALMLAPADRAAIFFGKALANLALMMVVEAFAVPAFAVLFGRDIVAGLPLLALSLVLGSAGFILVGTFLASLTANARASEVLLPVLLFPLSVPVLIAAVRGTAVALAGGTIADAGQWIPLLVIYDLIFATLAYMLFDYVLET